MEAAGRIPYFRLGAVLFASVVIACTWLVFPYLIQGQQILRNVGDDVRLTKAGQVSMYLTRDIWSITHSSN